MIILWFIPAIILYIIFTIFAIANWINYKDDAWALNSWGKAFILSSLSMIAIVSLAIGLANLAFKT